MKMLEREDLFRVVWAAQDSLISASERDALGKKPKEGDKPLKRLALIYNLLAAARDIYDGRLEESKDIVEGLPFLLGKVIEDESQN